MLGADGHPGRSKAFGGFDASFKDPDEAEVKRLFTALSEDGNVIMPLAATFWSLLFGRCTDKFGVNWMISVPRPKAWIVSLAKCRPHG